jgi:phosphotriesterase-related protein
MQTIPETWAGRVMTVNGLIPSEELGITLPHEHLIVQGWDYQERNYFNSAFMELVKYRQSGGKTLVDLPGMGSQRDPRFVHRLAAQAGLNVVMGVGFFQEAWLPEEVHHLTIDDMAEIIARDICEGVGDTGIHAGIIGEIGVSRRITDTEKRTLAAAARAQRRTGAAIHIHLEIGRPASEYHAVLDILENEGADLTRVALDHFVPRPDALELCQELAGRGCFLEFDLFGQERWLLMADLMHTDPDVQISSIKGFLDNGLKDHLLLSQNICHVDLLTVNGGDGYAHLLKNVLPKLKNYSVTDAELETLLVHNPRRFLTLREYR